MDRSSQNQHSPPLFEDSPPGISHNYDNAFGYHLFQNRNSSFPPVIDKEISEKYLFSHSLYPQIINNPHKPSQIGVVTQNSEQQQQSFNRLEIKRLQAKVSEKQKKESIHPRQIIQNYDQIKHNQKHLQQTFCDDSKKLTLEEIRHISKKEVRKNHQKDKQQRQEVYSVPVDISPKSWQDQERSIKSQSRDSQTEKRQNQGVSMSFEEYKKSVQTREREMKSDFGRNQRQIGVNIETRIGEAVENKSNSKIQPWEKDQNMSGYTFQRNDDFKISGRGKEISEKSMMVQSIGTNGVVKARSLSKFRLNSLAEDQFKTLKVEIDVPSAKNRLFHESTEAFGSNKAKNNQLRPVKKISISLKRDETHCSRQTTKQDQFIQKIPKFKVPTRNSRIGTLNKPISLAIQPMKSEPFKQNLGNKVQAGTFQRFQSYQEEPKVIRQSQIQQSIYLKSNKPNHQASVTLQQIALSFIQNLKKLNRYDQITNIVLTPPVTLQQSLQPKQEDQLNDKLQRNFSLSLNFPSNSDAQYGQDFQTNIRIEETHQNFKIKNSDELHDSIETRWIIKDINEFSQTNFEVDQQDCNCKEEEWSTKAQIVDYANLTHTQLTEFQRQIQRQLDRRQVPQTIEIPEINSPKIKNEVRLLTQKIDVQHDRGSLIAERDESSSTIYNHSDPRSSRPQAPLSQRAQINKQSFGECSPRWNAQTHYRDFKENFSLLKTSSLVPSQKEINPDEQQKPTNMLVVSQFSELSISHNKKGHPEQNSKNNSKMKISVDLKRNETKEEPNVISIDQKKEDQEIVCHKDSKEQPVVSQVQKDESPNKGMKELKSMTPHHLNSLNKQKESEKNEREKIRKQAQQVMLTNELERIGQQYKHNLISQNQMFIDQIDDQFRIEQKFDFKDKSVPSPLIHIPSKDKEGEIEWKLSNQSLDYSRNVFEGNPSGNLGQASEELNRKSPLNVTEMIFNKFVCSEQSRLRKSSQSVYRNNLQNSQKNYTQRYNLVQEENGSYEVLKNEYAERDSKGSSQDEKNQQKLNEVKMIEMLTNILKKYPIPTTKGLTNKEQIDLWIQVLLTARDESPQDQEKHPSNNESFIQPRSEFEKPKQLSSHPSQQFFQKFESKDTNQEQEPYFITKLSSLDKESESESELVQDDIQKDSPDLQKENNLSFEHIRRIMNGKKQIFKVKKVPRRPQGQRIDIIQLRYLRNEEKQVFDAIDLLALPFAGKRGRPKKDKNLENFSSALEQEIKDEFEDKKEKSKSNERDSQREFQRREDKFSSSYNQSPYIRRLSDQRLIQRNDLSFSQQVSNYRDIIHQKPCIVEENTIQREVGSSMKETYTMTNKRTLNQLNTMKTRRRMQSLRGDSQLLSKRMIVRGHKSRLMRNDECLYRLAEEERGDNCDFIILQRIRLKRVTSSKRHINTKSAKISASSKSVSVSQDSDREQQKVLCSKEIQNLVQRASQRSRGSASQIRDSVQNDEYQKRKMVLSVPLQQAQNWTEMDQSQQKEDENEEKMKVLLPRFGAKKMDSGNWLTATKTITDFIKTNKQQNAAPSIQELNLIFQQKLAMIKSIETQDLQPTQKWLDIIQLERPLCQFKNISHKSESENGQVTKSIQSDIIIEDKKEEIESCDLDSKIYYNYSSNMPEFQPQTKQTPPHQSPQSSNTPTSPSFNKRLLKFSSKHSPSNHSPEIAPIGQDDTHLVGLLLNQDYTPFKRNQINPAQTYPQASHQNQIIENESSQPTFIIPSILLHQNQVLTKNQNSLKDKDPLNEVRLRLKNLQSPEETNPQSNSPINSVQPQTHTRSVTMTRSQAGGRNAIRFQGQGGQISSGILGVSLSNDGFGPISSQHSSYGDSLHQLVQCLQYPSFENQPYRIYFTFEVQMLMYIHSYLSKNEVIGLVGGKIYKTNLIFKNQQGLAENVKMLVINKIYPSESCIKNERTRLKNCELSDSEQIRIQDQMDKEGVQKLGWYHSHPVFEVDPSFQDLKTHFQQQVNFTRQGLPFLGVIVGPYSPRQGIKNTMVNVFNLKEDLLVQRPGSRQIDLKDFGRQFHFKMIPRSKLRYSTWNEIKNMVKDSSIHQSDKPDLTAEWTNRKQRQSKFNLRQKFILSLLSVCESNLERLHSYNPGEEIFSVLEDREDATVLQNQLDDYFCTTGEKQSWNSLTKNFNEGIPVGYQAADRELMGDYHSGSYCQMSKNQILGGQGEVMCWDVSHRGHSQDRQTFSIGDRQKMIKYMSKLESFLQREFRLNGENQMYLLYNQLKGEESLRKTNNQMDKICQRYSNFESDSQCLRDQTAGFKQCSLDETSGGSGQGFQREKRISEEKDKNTENLVTNQLNSETLKPQFSMSGQEKEVKREKTGSGQVRRKKEGLRQVGRKREKCES